MDKQEEYNRICRNLEKIIRKTGEPLEGNCVYRHMSFKRWGCLLNKRKNYQRIVKNKNKISEIGFNAGHSILAMLLVNQNAEYVLFDIGLHQYSKPCLEYLKTEFPNTKINMFWGDSRTTVPDFIQSNPDTRFDVIHIDGGHAYEVYSKDWDNALNLILYGGILIFDDTDNKKINNFVDSQIKSGIVKEAKEYLETYGYEHRILIKQ